MKKLLRSAICVLYIYKEIMICSFLFFLLLSFVNLFLYCKWYAMFSFCREGVLHYILLLNLVKQIQWKH